MSIKKRLHKIQTTMSGFKSEKERYRAINFIRRLDLSVTPEEVQTFDDYIEILKTFLPPLPGTPQYEEWFGSDQHKKYIERQKQHEELQ